MYSMRLSASVDVVRDCTKRVFSILELLWFWFCCWMGLLLVGHSEWLLDVDAESPFSSPFVVVAFALIVVGTETMIFGIAASVMLIASRVLFRDDAWIWGCWCVADAILYFVLYCVCVLMLKIAPPLTHSRTLLLRLLSNYVFIFRGSTRLLD